MAKAKLSNAQIINAIRSVASQDFQSRIPLITKENIAKVDVILEQYPTTKNEFIEVLTNQVVKTRFLSKLYENPLRFFKKGTLPFGKTIESVFVDLVQAKDFTENFGDSQVSSLISKQPVDNVHVEYISENYRNKYKITISDDQLAGALRSENGLSDLVGRLISAPLTSAEQDEYLMIRQTLCNLAIKEIGITGFKTLDEDKQAKKLTKVIKTYVGKFRFMSNEYNAQGVNTHSTSDDLVVLVTPETKANIDVELLATAFNLSPVDLDARLVMIDKFTKKVDDEGTITYEDDTDTLAILCDKELLQIWDTRSATDNFRNGDRLETNFFYHRWGIMAGSGFVNAIKIKAL